MLVGNNCTGFVIFSGRNNRSNRVFDIHGDGGCVSTKEKFKTKLAVLSRKMNWCILFLDCILIIMYSCQIN